MIEKPNLFVVGAAKAGTTWVHTCLAGHPDVFMSRDKEPNFFGSDLRFRKQRMTEAEYLELFSPGMSKRFRGEASITYLLSRTAAGEIKGYSPDARIIIMVRNPVEIMHAIHAQNVLWAEEDIFDFEEALRAENDRKCGLRIPKHCTVLEPFFYREAVRLAEQISRYYKVFGRDAVFVGVYDDLVNDARALYVSLLQFLELRFCELGSYAPVNVRCRPRSVVLNKFLRGKVPPWVKKLVRSVIPDSEIRQTLSSPFLKLNLREVADRNLPDDLRMRLERELSQEIEALSVLLGRDLSQWIRSSPIKEQASVG